MRALFTSYMFSPSSLSPPLARSGSFLAALAVITLAPLSLPAQQESPPAEAAPQAQQPSQGQAPAAPEPPSDPVMQELLANSPFMSKAFKERLSKSDSSRTRDLVFRGFAGDGNTWLICVYNNQSKRSEWVNLGDQVNGITIAEFDKDALRIKVVKDATSTYLNLEQPKQ